MALNFDVSPYYDDTDEMIAKKYLRSLFHPKRPVQARELTGIQRTLQDQIGKFADHIFENGSPVFEGGLNINFQHAYVKLVDPSGSIELDSLVGLTFTNDTTVALSDIGTANDDGIQAIVNHVVPNLGGTQPATIYVTYTSGDGAGNSVYSASQTLRARDANGNLVTLTTAPSSPSGKGTTATIKQGIYYMNDFFHVVDSQIIAVERYSSTPSKRIGLRFVESYVTHKDDSDLLDNAAGFTNETAPGANRYKVELTLEAADPDIDDSSALQDEDFAELAKVDNGVIIRFVRGPNYSELGDVLAKRTFEESGDYTVESFVPSIQEHESDPDKFVINVDPGVGYIKGYRVETVDSIPVTLDKTRRDPEDVNLAADGNNIFTFTSGGSYVQITGASGFIAQTSASEYATVLLEDGSGVDIATAKLRAVRRTPAGDPDEFDVFIFDLRYESGKSNTDFTDSPPSTLKIKNAAYGTFTGNIVFQSDGNAVKTPESNAAASSTSYIKSDDQDTFSYSVGASNLASQQNSLPLLVRLPQESTKEVNDITFEVIRYFTGNDASSGSFTINQPTAELTFTETDIEDYTVIDVTNGGNILTPVTDFTISVNLIDGSDIDFNIVGVSPPPDNVAVIAPMTKTSPSAAKTKTETTVVDEVTAAITNGTAKLEHADVIEITTVETSGGDDVTELFDFNSGQRDNFYDVGYIIDKTGNYEGQAMTVTYKYYAHGGGGDYFDVNSYPVDPEDVGTYTSSKGDVYKLKNVLDFRPRAEDLSVQDTDNLFNGTGANLSSVLRPDSAIQLDLDYYLNRIDKVYIDTEGNLGVLQGISALNPKRPENLDNALTLFEVRLPPYIDSINDIDIIEKDNRRYTMRDINNIEKRVKNLEDVTTLSLLEVSLANLQIFDDQGRSRFKNGFLVDPFNHHGYGDVNSDDYHCSMDQEFGFLAPEYNLSFVPVFFDHDNVTDNVNIKFHDNISGADPDDIETNVGDVRGNLVTLDYTEKLQIRQPFTTRFDKINPNQTNVQFGLLHLSSAWERSWNKAIAPIVNSPDINFYAERNIIDENKVFGIRKSGWNTMWFGDPDDETDNPEFGRRIKRKITNRRIKFQAQGLKKNTQVYPFFDGVDISAYCYPKGGSFGDALVTSRKGNLKGIFQIPDPLTDATAPVWLDGIRYMRLTDSSDNDPEDITTLAETPYVIAGKKTAKAFLRSTLPTRRERKRLRRGVTGGPLVTNIDPIAQSFSFNLQGGVFLTKINLYFSQKDENDIPVKLHIVPTDNGVPDNEILPYSEVLVEAEDVNTSIGGTEATTFEFTDPVYLLPNQEYAFVISTASTSYEIATGEGGKNDGNTGALATQAAGVGKMFQSIDETSWNEQGNRAVRFDAYVADFFKGAAVSSATGTLLLNNGVDYLNGQDVDTYANLVSRADNLDVTNPAAIGADYNPFVQIINDRDIITEASSDIITINQPNHGFQAGDKVLIHIPGYDESSTELVNNLTMGDLVGEQTVYTDTANEVLVDSYQIQLQSPTTTPNADAPLSLGSNNIVYITRNIAADIMKPVVSQIVLSDTSIGWTLDTVTRRSINGSQTAYAAVTGEKVFNEKDVEFNTPRMIASTRNEVEHFSSGKSLKLKATLTTNRWNISPVIDIDNAQVVAVENRINNPAATERNYIAETAASGTSSAAKYISTPVTLQNSANSLRVFIGVNRPSGSDVEVYYRVLPAGDETSLDTVDWIQFDNPTERPTTDNRSLFYEYAYVEDGDGTGIEEFNRFQIKIVMQSSNAARVPKLTDFRTIATTISEGA